MLHRILSPHWGLRSRSLVSVCAVAALAGAQTIDTGTRAEEIEAQQRAKARRTAPDEPNRVEQVFIKLEKITDRLFGNTSGFRPVIGNLVPGSGFAAGVEYFRPDLHDGMVLFRSSARASLWRYELVDAKFALPHLARDRAFLDIYGTYQNYPSINYYGQGPRSLKSGRSDFRLEDAAFDATFGVRPHRHLRAGISAGYLRMNIGPGTNDRFVSAEQIYSEAEAPGILNQSDFLRGGPFIQYDYRDHPGDPHTGGNYVSSFIYYDDLRLNTGNHRKLYGEVQQYVPFFNQKRVIALRGKTVLSYRNTNQVVPFYLQPVLGGSDELRGFRPFRFYDNNLLVINAEYRWEVMSGFDVALFTDWGKVFHRHAELNLADLETSEGFGLRFKSRDAVFMRWDVGFSREGFQVWIKFNNVF